MDARGVHCGAVADRKLTELVLDTSYLRAMGIGHPDLRKLFEFAKAKQIRIFVPHIAWEEWRTRLLENTVKDARGLRAAHRKLVDRMVTDPLLGGMERPALGLWEDTALVEQSKKFMDGFAAEYGIQVVKLGADHAERAWDRFFRGAPPFDGEGEREQRRKHIPDSWILEAAIDLKAQHPQVLALCCDKGLSTAFSSHAIGARYESPEKAADLTRQLIAEIVAELAPPEVSEGPSSAEHVEEKPAADAQSQLDEAQAAFKGVDIRVLGFVTYLGDAPKDQILKLLERSGIREDVARNAADRLVISKLIEDTGHYYLAIRSEAGENAAAQVEPEIIELLRKST